ncbi:glycosyltransferase family 2 protein [Dysgonomonas sp. 520]|uniref:glycosyltransferase family 2 protein n=1 Tax=Dysgonomonas sp. 520 TaxID=2302931 RepID=UPI0013D62BEA|nr:glycosyltransferase family 2 protein [Dysgonomonas sp. 520]NDW10317.1 glycosyltransferase [Dysgonomonas sp. 520]
MTLKGGFRHFSFFAYGMKVILSIITVNLNNAKGLEETIKSVIGQTYHSYEYIVIDGASTDGSTDVIKKYSSNINIHISEPDSGIFNAMNKGIKLAKGKYCLFLNSGDSFVSDDVLQNIFEQTDYSSPFINGNQVNDWGDHKSTVKNKGRDLTLYDFYAGTIKHQATFIRRDLFDKYGLYDESLKIVSDWKFFLEVIGLHNEQPTFVDIDIVNFSWDGISTDKKMQEKHDKEREKVLSECIPPSVRKDYEQLQLFKNYEYLIIPMRNNKFLFGIVRFFVRLFR